MGNTGTAMIKIAVAAGGAVLGVLLARWSDDLISSRLQEKSEFDKTRYEQGLPAHKLPPRPVIQPPLPSTDDDFEPGPDDRS